MLAVIVFESLLGNTRRVAEAIAGGISEAHPDATVSCGTPGQVGGEAATADLLVVGAPTHFFGLPSRRSRHLWTRGYQRAGRTGASGPPLEPGAEGPGVREWLAGLPAVENNRLAAAFDTRLRRPTSGAAARRIARRLRRADYRLAAPPAGFFVDDMTGPLGRGELDGPGSGVRGWWHNGSHELLRGVEPCRQVGERWNRTDGNGGTRRVGSSLWRWVSRPTSPTTAPRCWCRAC